MLINPDNLSKVSCFENFKELAFSVGNNLLDPNLQSVSDSSVAESTRIVEVDLNVPKLIDNRNQDQSKQQSILPA